MGFAKNRRKTREIRVGKVKVGNFAPVSVQSMTNTFTKDIRATISQIHQLADAGCEIVRVAVVDEEDAEAISQIQKEISIPLIADIHFDHRLAIISAKAGADCLRINPGNIGDKQKVEAVCKTAKERGIPIRIGVNSGSVEKEIVRKHNGATVEAMVESAMNHISLAESYGLNELKVSIKASDVYRTINAYRLLARKTDHPLHLGVTEAGTLFSGLVKSSIGIGTLLAEGIGDTLRVSLTRPPAEEVQAGYEILKALNIRRRGPEIISCPTCGRCRIPLFDIVAEVEKKLAGSTQDIRVAVMGCVVNGPGEAKEADIGIAGGDGIGILFKQGKVVKKFSQNNLVPALMEAIREFGS